MLYSGTDPESYITEYTLVYEDERTFNLGLLRSVDRLWEGNRESRRCSRDTYPESYITKYTSVQEYPT